MTAQEEGRPQRRDRPTSNPTITSQNRSTTLGSTAFVSIRDQVAAGIITTTRKCDPFGCWCHTGDVVVTYDHRQYMDTLAREIRVLEVSEGVLAL